MPSNGSFSHSFKSGYTLSVEWVITSQSMEDNTSTLSVTAYLSSSSSGFYISSSAEKTIRLYIDGKTYSKTEANLAKLNGKQKKELFTQVVTVTHDTDGRRSVDMACEFDIEVKLSDKWYGTVRAPEDEGTFVTAVLTEIPKPTVPTLATTDIVMGSDVKISLPRKSDSFLHTLKTEFMGVTKTIATNVSTEKTFNFPIETYAPDIPNATKSTGTLICETYREDYLVGTRTAQFTLSVPDSVIPSFVSPFITAVETISGVNEKFSNFIQGISKPKINVYGQGIYGSEIRDCTVEFDGWIYSGEEVTCEKISGSGELTIKAIITDTRGREQTKTTTVTVLPYEAPTVTKLTAYRCDENGVETSDGTRVKIEYAFDISTINNLNNKWYGILYRETDGSDWTYLKGGNSYSMDESFITESLFDVDKTYELWLNVTDYFYQSKR